MPDDSDYVADAVNGDMVDAEADKTGIAYSVKIHMPDSGPVDTRKEMYDSKMKKTPNARRKA